jgi:dTMP kinase
MHIDLLFYYFIDFKNAFLTLYVLSKSAKITFLKFFKKKYFFIYFYDITYISEKNKRRSKMDAGIGKKFIVFEGIDGCGKSTQIKLLGEYFLKKGIDYYITREPIENGVGAYIRKEILSGVICSSALVQAYLFAAQRAQNVIENILPNLINNKFVLCDRHVDSSIVYQGAVLKLGESFVQQINEAAISEVSPEITFVIDITPEESIRRITSRSGENKEIFEKIEMMQTARISYIKLAKNEQKRTMYKIIDGMKTQNEIQEEIRGFIAMYYSLQTWTK